MRNWKAFIIGALSMFIMMLGIYFVLNHPQQSPTAAVQETAALDNAAPTPVLPHPVTITTLPSLQMLLGDRVAFEGKKEFHQTLAGRYAQKVTIVNFQATGDHAEKSQLKIVWENGEIDMVAPGTKDKNFPPEKRAVSISVLGYSMHERHIFRDSPRKGTLTWEIHYEPAN